MSAAVSQLSPTFTRFTVLTAYLAVLLLLLLLLLYSDCLFVFVSGQRFVTHLFFVPVGTNLIE